MKSFRLFSYIRHLVLYIYELIMCHIYIVMAFAFCLCGKKLLTISSSINLISLLSCPSCLPALQKRSCELKQIVFRTLQAHATLFHVVVSKLSLRSHGIDFQGNQFVASYSKIGPLSEMDISLIIISVSIYAQSKVSSA